MTVEYLWETLQECCEKEKFSGDELRNKKMAIDLSNWIVASDKDPDKTKPKNLYLLNTFIRTACLLEHGVLPVCVLDAEKPPLWELKQAHKKKKKPQSTNIQGPDPKQNRKYFIKQLKECEKMLRLMGLKCVQAEGEGEAMCAYLNADGIVDGCISQDGDCFLYGAGVVYKDFEFREDPGKGIWGSANVYKMERIENELKLDRNKLIAFALLCGCDYTKGLNRIGKAKALNLFKRLDDGDILESFKSWKKSDKKLDGLEPQLKKRKTQPKEEENVCAKCGHEGTIKVHAETGCSVCKMKKKCRALIEHEKEIRKKAALRKEFPKQEIIHEFLVRNGKVPSKEDLKWQKPKLENLVSFMNEKLGSERELKPTICQLIKLWNRHLN